jgi:hypothetical protein
MTLSCKHKGIARKRGVADAVLRSGASINVTRIGVEQPYVTICTPTGGAVHRLPDGHVARAQTVAECAG